MRTSEALAQSTADERSRRSTFVAAAIVVVLIIIAALLPGDYRVAATLGIVQGLGEFLPISSSAHLIITPWLMGWTGPAYAFLNSQTFDVALHMGTLVALVLLFWHDWLNLVMNAHRPQTTEGKLFWLLVLATIPGVIFGLVLDKYASEFFADKYLLIAATLALMGIALYWADAVAEQRFDLHHISWRSALLIGLSQALALIPGVSRSGSTMTMGRALGLKRETAARFSFLMATPITAGAGILKLRKLTPDQMTLPFWLGIVVAAIVGILAISFLLRFLQRRGNSFLPFAVYRVGLAILIVIVYMVRQ